MTVHFIGAGPGAADLITVRGRTLVEKCPVCLYAGSIVRRDPGLVFTGGARRRHGSLDLDAVVAEFIRAHERGEDLAPSFRRPLDLERARRADAPPRCPAHPLHAHPRRTGLRGRRRCARARADGPGGCAIRRLTRTSGRASTMPENKSSGLRQTQATLAIHLSIHVIERVVAELLPAYGAQCPAAVVWRASWPDERVLKGTLATIAGLCPRERLANELRRSWSAPPSTHPVFATTPSIRPTTAAGSRTRAGRGGPVSESDEGRVRPPAAITGLSPGFAAGTVWLVGAGPGDPGAPDGSCPQWARGGGFVVYDALVELQEFALARRAPLEYAGKRGGSLRRFSATSASAWWHSPARGSASCASRAAILSLRAWRRGGFGPRKGGCCLPHRPRRLERACGAAVHGIPATTRATNHALILATGHCAADEVMDWAALRPHAASPSCSTWPWQNLPALVTGLVHGGLSPSTPAIAVHAATGPDETVVEATLEQLPALAADGSIKSPAIIAIGAIAGFRSAIVDCLLGLKEGAAP